MKKLHFNPHLDLNACTYGQTFKTILIQRLSHFISKKTKQQARADTPQWRDFLLVFLIHHCFPLFQAVDKLRGLLIRLINRFR
ncbi:MAG: hypothetical protein Q8K59_12630 [Nitrosomonas sp.]|nr:hypothetical protein [Nitrosomonas sp.]MDP1951908.1 hypothetical protein [Nitrosomonas sp.]